MVQLIGHGLAVTIDATVVRVVLVPATMELLRRANWWLPRWLDRIIPRIEVEGGSADVAPARVPAGVGAGRHTP